MAINAKIDLAGPDQRGLAVGIDEALEETHPEFGTHEPPAPATEPPSRTVSDG